MNYTTITINGEKIGLKFGMASFRYLDEKIQGGKLFDDTKLSEIAIAHIMYSGYFNNCLVKEVDAKYTFADFVDYIEDNFDNAEVMAEIGAVVEVWAKNKFLQSKASEEPKKKNSRGKK